MEKLVYFDYCAFIIFCILLVSTLMRRITLGKSNHTFIAMVINCILTTIADIGAVQLDLLGAGNIIPKYILHTLYLLFHNLLPPIYVIYIFARTDTLYKLRQSRRLQYLFLTPIGVVTALLFVNCFWHIIFYLNEMDAYTRGAAFPIMYFVGIYYAGYGIIHLFQYRNTISSRRFVALLSLFPFTIIAVIIQFLNKNLLVEMFANACAILFISLLIQRPEERMHPETGLEKQSAYVADVKHSFAIGKSIEIIMINIVNYASIQEMLGYDRTLILKKIIADAMLELNKKYKANADLYYISNGKFRFVLSDHIDNTEEIAAYMNEFF